MVMNLKKIVVLGAFAYCKYGPENITLFQLAQAEAEGFFEPEECQALGEISHLNFKSDIKDRPGKDTKRST